MVAPTSGSLDDWDRLGLVATAVVVELETVRILRCLVWPAPSLFNSEEGRTMMNRRTMVATAVLAMVAAATSYAFVGNRVNNVTFNRSVALPGVMLSAGAYKFEVLEPGVGVDIVRVWNRDKTRVFYTGIT